MRKLIMWNIVTLDGYFEGVNNRDLPWHEQVWGEELERFSLEQLGSADMLVFGRVTYEGMAAYWTTAQGAIADYMNRLPKDEGLFDEFRIAIAPVIHGRGMLLFGDMDNPPRLRLLDARSLSTGCVILHYVAEKAA